MYHPQTTVLSNLNDCQIVLQLIKRETVSWLHRCPSLFCAVLIACTAWTVLTTHFIPLADVKTYRLPLIIKLCIPTYESAPYFQHIGSSCPLNIHPTVSSFNSFLIMRPACETQETTSDEQSPSLIKQSQSLTDRNIKSRFHISPCHFLLYPGPVTHDALM